MIPLRPEAAWFGRGAMDELAFLPATEQARLVREREVSPVELVELYLERIERLDPELGAYVTVRGEEALADARAKADEPAEAPFHGVPISLKDLDTTAGIRTTFSCARVRRQRPRLRPGARRAAEGGRLRRPRQDEHAGVRHDRVHRLGAERPLPDALGPVAERGRLERRRRRRARGRPLRDRAGLGRRRLDPHPRLVLRRLRLQGLARPRLERAVRARDRARHDRAARPHDRRRRRLPRRRRAATSGATRSPPPPPERPFAEEIGVDPGRLRVALTTDAARRTRRWTTPASPPPATPPSCSPRSATRSRRPRPTGAARA